ncbi:MAG: YDG domain-containing protein, partial [Sulfuritalea sp.]|nr:YDG domain-containing protein [Sulfuritalea sp.]
MNHTYRLVFNAGIGACVAAPETAKGRGKGGNKGHKRGLVAAAILAACALPAHALPTGGAVSAGTGTIGTAGNVMTVNQSSARLAIDWSSFNIAAAETVNFVQPSASAIALNRVLGSDASAIYGKLNANGQVFLLNPNGILFGRGAEVNVGGLVASTLALSNADFMAGRFRFAGTAGSVTNEGTLTAADGGYVALLGGQVSNRGTLTARLGNVALAASSDVTLDFAGDGLVSVQVNQGTVNALAENKQLIRADGGNVLLTARAADALIQAVVNNEGVIEARTVENRGGVIKLMGDMQNGTVNVAGTLDASAPLPTLQGEGRGGDGANGGFIETSAAHVKVADGAKVTTLAANGKNGTWLIDPQDYTIAASSGDISGATLGTNLNNGNVTILSSSGATAGNGDINVNDAVSWSANTTLNLQAANVINVNADITASGASAGLALSAPGRASWPYAGTAGSIDGILFPLVIRPGPRPGITLSGANATLSIDGTPYTLIHDINALQAIKDGDLNGHYALAGNIDATATATWNPDGNGGYLGFEPIAYHHTAAPFFGGTLQGLGHTITGLYINRVDSVSDVRTGLIGNSYLARVENLGLVGGSTTAFTIAGGIIGSMVGGRLWNVYNSGEVRAYAGAGGLVGFAQSDLGTLDSPSIASSYASGNVTARTDAGGLVAHAWGLNIYFSYASANVTAILDLALAPNPPAYGYALSEYLGGLVGTLVSGYIRSSYATGVVTGGATANMNPSGGRIGTWYVGGLVGELVNDASVWHSYATGAVTGTNYVGGLFGNVTSNAGSPSIKYTYATGSVTGLPGANNIGGYAGGWHGLYTFISNSYWDIESTGQANGDGSGDGSFLPTAVVGRTHAQMLQPANFFDFDLTAPVDASNENWAFWTQYPGHTAPLLRYMMTPLLVTADNTNVGKTYDGTAWTGTLPNASYQVTGGPSNSEHQDLVYSSERWARGMSPASTTVPAGVYNTATPYGTQTAVGTYGPDLWSPQFGYHIAYNTTSQLAITPKPLGLPVADTRNYDGTTAATLSGAGLSGLVGSDVVGIVPGYTAAFADPNAGSGKTVNVSGLALNGAAAGNYMLAATGGATTGTIAPRPLDVIANAADKTYDGVAYSGGNGVTYGSLVGSDTAAAVVGGTLAYGGTAQGAVNAGNYAITPSGLTSLSGNYVIRPVSGVLAVGPTELTVTGSFTAANKVYDGTIAATIASNALTLSGLVGADSVTPNWNASFHGSGAANGRLVTLDGTTFSGLSGSNYYFIANNAPWTYADITRAPLTVTASAASKTYDGLAYSGGNGAAYAGLVNGQTSAVLGGTLAYAGTSQGAVNAGNYVITPSGLTSFNYTIDYAPGALTVNKAPMTVKATDAWKTYDGNTYAGGNGVFYRSSDFVNGEGVEVIGGALTMGGTSQGAVNAGSYSIKPSGLTAANYAFNYLDGILTVNKVPLTVSGSFTTANKLYDGTTAATIANNALGFSGLIGSESVTPNWAASFADKDVGNGKPVNLSATTFGGASGGNYTVNLTTAPTATANITPAPLTVRYNAVSKTYDGSGFNPYFDGNGVSYTGFVNGETEAVLGNRGRLAYETPTGGCSANAGSCLILPYGLTSSNYAINFASGTLTVNKAPLTISTGNVVKTYDGTTGAVGSATVSGGGLYGTDSLSGGSFAFTDKNAGTGNKTVTVSGVTVNDGNGGNNYTVGYATNTTSTINKAPLTVTANAAGKDYDGNAYSGGNGVTYSGLVGSDTAAAVVGGTLAYGGTAQGAVNAGNYAITPSGLTSLSGN